MRAAGIEPALICAHERTGLIVTTENRHLMSAADLGSLFECTEGHQ